MFGAEVETKGRQSSQLCALFPKSVKSFGSTCTQSLWVRGIKPRTPLVFVIDHTPINRWVPYKQGWEEKTVLLPCPLGVWGERMWPRDIGRFYQTDRDWQTALDHQMGSPGRSLGNTSFFPSGSQRLLRKELEKMDSCVQAPCQHSQMVWRESRLRASLF